MKYKMKFFAVTVVIIATLSTVSRAQNENIRGILRTATGLLVVWNEPGNNFTLDVKGSNFENIPTKDVAFLLDGKFLQVVSASTKDVLADSKRQQKLDDNEILIAHQTWETKYLKDDAGAAPKGSRAGIGSLLRLYRALGAAGENPTPKSHVLPPRLGMASARHQFSCSDARERSSDANCHAPWRMLATRGS